MNTIIGDAQDRQGVTDSEEVDLEIEATGAAEEEDRDLAHQDQTEVTEVAREETATEVTETMIGKIGTIGDTERGTILMRDLDQDLEEILRRRSRGIEVRGMKLTEGLVIDSDLLVRAQILKGDNSADQDLWQDLQDRIEDQKEGLMMVGKSITNKNAKRFKMVVDLAKAQERILLLREMSRSLQSMTKVLTKSKFRTELIHVFQSFDT